MRTSTSRECNQMMNSVMWRKALPPSGMWGRWTNGTIWRAAKEESIWSSDGLHWSRRINWTGFTGMSKFLKWTRKSTNFDQYFHISQRKWKNKSLTLITWPEIYFISINILLFFITGIIWFCDWGILWLIAFYDCFPNSRSQMPLSILLFYLILWLGLLDFMTIFLQILGEKATFLFFNYSCLRQFQLIMLSMLSKICQTRRNLQFQLMILVDTNKEQHHLRHVLPLKQKIPYKWLISINFYEWKGPITHLRYTWCKQIDNCGWS